MPVTKSDTAETGLQDAVRKVGVLTQAESEALRAQSQAADAVQPLREEEATRGAVLHRLSVERDTLDEEESRMLARRTELEERHGELGE